MNKTQWEASNDPLPMLDWLHERSKDRKFRLLACACMRRVEGLLVGYYHEAGPALQAAERLADGELTSYTPPRRGLWAVGADPRREAVRLLVEIVTTLPGWSAAKAAAREIVNVLSYQRQATTSLARNEARMQAGLVRDLFGHLFHPNPLWLARLDHVNEVEHVARAIYDDHSFTDMPVLADALEEAGCADCAVLEHCREPSEHARGCWVLDAILGRQ